MEKQKPKHESCKNDAEFWSDIYQQHKGDNYFKYFIALLVFGLLLWCLPYLLNGCAGTIRSYKNLKSAWKE
jgi:hypothetical protein